MLSFIFSYNYLQTMVIILFIFLYYNFSLRYRLALKTPLEFLHNYLSHMYILLHCISVNITSTFLILKSKMDIYPNKNNLILKP